MQKVNVLSEIDDNSQFMMSFIVLLDCKKSKKKNETSSLKYKLVIKVTSR